MIIIPPCRKWGGKGPLILRMHLLPAAEVGEGDRVTEVEASVAEAEAEAAGEEILTPPSGLTITEAGDNFGAVEGAAAVV